jgi:hypothetical protein
MADLDDDERQLAEGRTKDRGLVLNLLAKLPGGRVTGAR